MDKTTRNWYVCQLIFLVVIVYLAYDLGLSKGRDKGYATGYRDGLWAMDQRKPK